MPNRINLSSYKNWLKRHTYKKVFNLGNGTEKQETYSFDILEYLFIKNIISMLLLYLGFF